MLQILFTIKIIMQEYAKIFLYLTNSNNLIFAFIKNLKKFDIIISAKGKVKFSLILFIMVIGFF